MSAYYEYLLATFEYKVTERYERAIYYYMVGYGWYSKWHISWPDYQTRVRLAKVQFMAHMRLPQLGLLESQINILAEKKQEQIACDVGPFA